MLNHSRLRLPLQPPATAVPMDYRDLFIDGNGDLRIQSPDGSTKDVGGEGISTPAILGKLQGAAADPNRIGAEYFPEALPAAIIQLADTTGLILPPASLGADAAGNVVTHDGMTAGGNRINRTVGTRLVGTVVKPASEMGAMIAVKLGEFPLAAENAVAGKSLVARGRVWSHSSTGNLTGRIGISSIRQRSLTSGISHPSTLTGWGLPGNSVDSGTPWSKQIDCKLNLGVSGEYLGLTVAPLYETASYDQYVVSGALTGSGNTTTIQTSTLFTPGSAEAVELWVATEAPFTSANFKLSYDLEFLWV